MRHLASSLVPDQFQFIFTNKLSTYETPNYSTKSVEFFYTSLLQIYVWYSLETPFRDAFNEYHNICVAD